MTRLLESKAAAAQGILFGENRGVDHSPRADNMALSKRVTKKCRRRLADPVERGGGHTKKRAAKKESPNKRGARAKFTKTAGHLLERGQRPDWNVGYGLFIQIVWRRRNLSKVEYG